MLTHLSLWRMETAVERKNTIWGTSTNVVYLLKRHMPALIHRAYPFSPIPSLFSPDWIFSLSSLSLLSFIPLIEQITIPNSSKLFPHPLVLPPVLPLSHSGRRPWLRVRPLVSGTHKKTQFISGEHHLVRAGKRTKGVKLVSETGGMRSGSQSEQYE